MIGGPDSAALAAQSTATGLTRRKRDLGLPAAQFTPETHATTTATTSALSNGFHHQQLRQLPPSPAAAAGSHKLRRPPSLTEEYIVHQSRREGADGLSSSSDEEPEGLIQIEIFESSGAGGHGGNKSGNSLAKRSVSFPPCLNPLSVLVEEVGETVTTAAGGTAGTPSPSSPRRSLLPLSGAGNRLKKKSTSKPLPAIKSNKM